jgi:hypothetical protein
LRFLRFRAPVAPSAGHLKLQGQRIIV